jgi:T1SS-143 domain-containing protein
MATEQYNDTNATVSGNEELNEALGTVTPQGVEMRIAQASGDPVPIDVGEGEPETGVEAEVAVEIPAEVTPDAENVVRLPEGVSIEDIRVDGPNLVLVQPDGSRVTVVNAALDIPTFIIGDVEIAPEVLVAALEAQGIDVAAGPDGTFSVVSGTTSTNANFNEPLPGIGDAGPPIDLLPPTALAFEQLDGEELGPLDVRGPEFGDFGDGFENGGFLRLLEPALDKSDDDGQDIQAGTTTGTEPGDTGETRIGTIALTAGTSAVTSVYFFDPSSPSFVAPAISGVKDGTPALIWSLVGGRLIGSLPVEGGDPIQVVIMEITAPLPIPATQTADVTIRVTLLDAFPHADATSADNVTISGIQIGATDVNGLSASTTFGVIIVDDVPEIAIDPNADADHLSMLMDESVDDERYIIDFLGEHLKPDNADKDDTGDDFDPNKVTHDLTKAVAFGEQLTGKGVLENLFTKSWDFGADRKADNKPLVFNYSLVLKNEAGEEGGVKTSLVVTAHPQSDALKNLPNAERTIWLFNEGGVIVGRIGADEGAAKTGLIALTISIKDGADLKHWQLDDANLVVEQFLPIQHPHNFLHDEGVKLLLSGEGASLQLKLEGRIEDGDGDTDSDFAVVDLINGNKSFLTLEDDGPEVDVSGNGPGYGEGGLKLTLDESIGKDGGDRNAHRDDVDGVTQPTVSTTLNPANAIGIMTTGGGAGTSVKELFNVSVDAGTDGLKQETHHYSLTLTNALGLPGLIVGAKTTMVVTALPGSPLYGLSEAARTIWLFQQPDGTIVGKIGQTLFSGNSDDYIALRIRLDASDPMNPKLVVEQYLPIQHGDTGSHDEAAYLTFADAKSSLGINLTVKAVDGDNDFDIDSHTVIIADKNGSAIKIEDDGPSVKVDGAKDGWKPVTLDKIVLDETIGPKAGDSNADFDKVEGVTEPSLLLSADPTKAIGRLYTPKSDQGTSISELFKVTIDGGTDGLKQTTKTFSFVLKDDRGKEVSAGSDKGVQTNLKVTAVPDTDLANFTSGNLRISLFHEADGSIVGRIGQWSGTGDDDFIALRIWIDTSGSEPRLVVEQYLPIDHGNDGNKFDTAAILQFLDKDASLGLKLTVKVWDGDNDTDVDSHTVSLIDKNDSIVRFEDDGPTVKVEGAKDGWKPVTLDKIVLDETIGDKDGDDNASDDDTEQETVVITRNLNHAKAIGKLGTEGSDGASVSDLFKVTKDGGTDGLKNTVETFSFVLKDKDGKELKSNSKGVETNLKATALPGTVLDGKSDAFRTIWLTEEGGAIVGRVGKSTGSTNDDYVAFRISIEVGEDGVAHLVVEQFLPIDHGWDGNNHDADAWLKLVGNKASLGITMTVKVIDGDNDYAVDSHTVTIADKNGSPIKFQDDGPTADDTDAGKILDDEAQPGGVYGGPGDNGWGKSVSGQLDIDGGSDGIKSITFSKYLTVKNESDETVGLKAIWVDGEGVGHPKDVTVAWAQNGVGGKLTGTMTTPDGDKPVFELTVNADGSYTFKLLAPLSHPLTDGGEFTGSYEDLLALGFKFTVTDGDGDKASAKLTIEVDDDSPKILGIEPVGHGPNLVKNGSFEDGHNLPSGQWDIFKSIYHWSQGADGVPFEVQTGGAGGVGAQDGNAIIELDGDTQTNNQGGNGTPQAATNATIQQAIEGTVAGQAYKLTFHYAIRPEGVGSSGMEVWFGGVKVYTIADNAGIPANVWQQITIDVTAPSDDAVLEFRGTGTPNEFGALLDNVSMHGISPILVHDETQGVQDVADPNNQDDVAGAGLPADILALFDAIGQKGSDDDVDPKDNDAIGFARSGAENPAFQFSANFGADGAHAQNAVAYALKTDDGTDSGLKTTEGQSIHLYNEGGLIVGKIADGTVAFAVAIDPATGELFLAQYLSIEHGFAGDGSNGSHDELATILSGAIKATVTIKDGDGDSVTSDEVSIGHLIGFQDDGPSVSLDGTNALANGLFFDGFTPNNNAWGIGSGVATGTAGEWTITASPNSGAASPELQKVASGYRGAISPTGSLIVDMEASPGNIQITQEVSGLVDGHTYRLSFEIGEAADINAEAAENSAILEVWWNGELIGTYHPESGLMQTIVVDVVAGAGPNELQFREVGASGDNTGTFLANVMLSDVIIIDETPGLDADADDTANPLVAALFDGINGGVDPHMAAQFAQGSKAVVSPTIDFGSDGPGAGGGIAYSLSIVEGADSGLTTTEGEPILLYLDDAGRVIGVYDGNGAAGEVAIAFHIDPATGFLSVAQYVSLAHPDTDSSDEGIHLKPGSLGVTVTVTDGDGDTASASTDISGLVWFEDDGPTAVDTVAGKILDDERQAGGINDGPGDQTGGNYRFVKGTLAIEGGADGVKSIVFAEAVTVKDELPGSEVGTLLQAIHVDPDTKVGTPRDVALAWQADGNGGGTLTGTADDIGTVFELTVDKDGNYTFKLFAPLSHPLTTDGDAFVGSYEDLLALGFEFTVTDGDGDEATATLTIKVDDDSPMFGEVESITVDKLGIKLGTIEMLSGADGWKSISLDCNTAPEGLTSGGQQVQYWVSPDGKTLIGYVGDAPTDGEPGIDSQVFKLTLNPGSQKYEFELFKGFDGAPSETTLTAVGNSSFGSPPSDFQIITTSGSGGQHIAVVSGWKTTGAFNLGAWHSAANVTTGIVHDDINGSAVGWGVDNQNLNTGEMIRFDFGALADFDGAGGYVPPTGVFTGAEASSATFTFFQFNGQTIKYVVKYSDGTAEAFEVVPVSSGNPAPWSQPLTITSPDGKTIDYVEFLSPTNTGAGKIALTGATVMSTDGGAVDLHFDVKLTDGDGDMVKDAINVTVENIYQAPTGPTGDPLALKVKEEALGDGVTPSSQDGSNPGSTAEKDEGTLTFIQGSAPLTFAFAGMPVVTDAALSPVTQITNWLPSDGGKTLTGFIGSTAVIKLTLVAGTPGAGGEIDVTVEVTLLDNIPHHSTLVQVSDAADFITVTGIVVEADDGTGNPLGSVSGQLTIQVKDDVPEVEALVLRFANLDVLNLTVDETDDAAGTDRYAPGETTDDGNPDGNGDTAGLGFVTTNVTNGLWSLFGALVTRGADGVPSTSSSLRLRLVGAEEDGTLETTLKTIGGETIYLEIDAGNTAVTGVANGVTIFTIDFTSGTQLRLTMHQPIMHDDNTKFDENEVLKLAGDGAVQLVYWHRVTDGDGDQASDEATIDLVTKDGGYFSFDDDGPIAANDIATLGNALETVSGNVIAGTVTSGTGGADSPGSDGGAISKIAFGATEVSTFINNELVITTANGTLKIKADGSYTYTRANDDPVTVDEVFTYTLKDGDGDTTTATLTVKIADNGVTVGGVGAQGGDETVYEANLSDGSNPNPSALTQTGFFTISAPDGIGSVTVGGTPITPAQLADLGTTPVTIAGDYGTLILTGYDAVTGQVSYSYTMDDNTEDHDAAGNDDVTDSFAIVVTDIDGDTGSSTLTVKVVDDVPLAKDDTDAFGAGNVGTTIDGNVVTGVGTTGGAANADVTGADGFGSIVWTNANAGVIQGSYGYLTVDANGGYVYTRTSPAGGNDVFNYTLVDGDGDQSPAKLTITLANVALPTVTNPSVVADEDDIPVIGNDNTDSPGDAAQSGLTGSLGTYGPDGGVGGGVSFADMHGAQVTAPGYASVESGGSPLTYYWDPGSNTLYGTTNGANATTAASNAAFKIVVDQTDASYTFTLLKPLDHKENSTEDDIDLSISYEITDATGDTVPGTMSVKIDDDMPIAPDTTAIATAGVKPTVNAIFVIDLSGSMAWSIYDNQVPNNNPQGEISRLALLEQAVINLLSNPDVTFNQVTIYTFNQTTTYRGTFTEAGAINYVDNTLATHGLVNATNYGSVTGYVPGHYTTNLLAGRPDADKNFVYFLTDGDNTGAVNPDQAAWAAFLNSAGIDESFAVGFSGLAAPTPFLQTMAPRPGLDTAFVVSNPNMLAPTLEGSLPGNPSGNIFENQTGPVLGGFGADGGHVKEITYDGTTYSYNGTDPSVTIIDPIYGKLIFNFVDNGLKKAGDWDFYAPDSLGANPPKELEFEFTLVDGDGDEADGSLKIDVRIPPKPPVAPDVTTDVTIGAVVAVDPDSDPTDLEYELVGSGVGQNGVLTLNPDGSYSYSAAPEQAYSLTSNDLNNPGTPGTDEKISFTITGTNNSAARQITFDWDGLANPIVVSTDGGSGGGGRISALSNAIAESELTTYFNITRSGQNNSNITLTWKVPGNQPDVSVTGNSSATISSPTITQGTNGTPGTSYTVYKVEFDGTAGDTFNYKVTDQTGLSDTGTIRIVDLTPDFQIAGFDGSNGSTGDVLDLSSILSGATFASLGSFVRMSMEGGNLVVKVDRDGSGIQHDFVQLVTISGSGLSDGIRIKFGAGAAQHFANFVADPIILDLDGNGFTFASLSEGANFDLDGDGHKDRVAWNSSGDGILAFDANGNGIIDDGTELFTPWFNGGSFANGSEALASLDSNGDGIIDENDDAFANLLVWQDLNGDGVTDEGELRTLAEHGITSLSAGTSAAAYDIDGQGVVGEGTFTREDGSTGGYVEVQLDMAAGAGEEPAPAGLVLEGDPDQVDVLTGGDGDDTFVLNSLDVADIIADYGNGGDVLDLSLLLDQFNANNATSMSGADFVAQKVQYDEGSGSLKVDANNDGSFGADEEVAVLQNTPVADTIRILIDDQTYDNSGNPI